MEPLSGVSVIITAYNYGHFLAGAISSALHQSHPSVEVVVIDDGSTDNTPEVAASFGDHIRYMRQANAGLPRARNAGLHAASHQWVVFLDADDEMYPWMIEVALHAALKEKETPAVVAGQWIEWDEGAEEKQRQNVRATSTRRVGVESLVLRNRLAPTMLARRQVLLDLGGFDPAAGGADDRDMWIRIAARHAIILIDAPFYRFRLHTTSMSHDPVKHIADTTIVLARARRNTDIQLPDAVWRTAQAMLHYQSAMTSSMWGRYPEAFSHCLRSVFLQPWISSRHGLDLPPLARLRFLARHTQFILLPGTSPRTRRPSACS